MTPDEIAADWAVIDAATEGPWEAARDRGNWIVGDLWNGLNGMVGGFAAGHGGQAEADAAFIAAARTGWPRALDALEAAWAEVERLTAALALQAESVENAAAEVERLRRGEEDGIFTSVVHECCERVEKAGAAIARVRALHIADHDYWEPNGGATMTACAECGDDLPCPTLRALDKETG